MEKKTLTAVTYIEGFKPGYLGRIAQIHGEYYAKAWGSDTAFEAQMAHELSEFWEMYDPAIDMLLTAHIDGRLVGSIAIKGPRDAASPAQLRWFILAEESQGHGIGRVLLERVLNFCRDREFKKVFLWTVTGLPQSRHLYESVGFRVVETLHDERYVPGQISLKFELGL